MVPLTNRLAFRFGAVVHPRADRWSHQVVPILGGLAVAIADASDGYRWVGLDAEVAEVIDDQAVAQADIADLARRYHPDDPARREESVARFRTQGRVTFRLRVVSFHDHLDR